ncbi:SH3 domain-containing protein [Devosia enhydra]|uniref:SH3 domain-containing protein n=1 Tax=Devosia enhydra TaxID=665118 RepID=A0A1K2HZ14_9HYPH|nr:SH3 domain-containing protein [Devosia enhydra]SFZ85380.1 SH3 domain-containing protein [Devosia enhydra]
MDTQPASQTADIKTQGSQAPDTQAQDVQAPDTQAASVPTASVSPDLRRARLLSAGRYAGVLMASLIVIGGAVGFSAQAAGSMVSIKSAARADVRQSYAMPLPDRKAADFNVARATPAVVEARASVMQAALPAPAAEVAAKPSRPHRIVASSLNIRSRPGQGGTLFSLPRGSVVDVAEVQGNWLRITAPDGRSGWAFSRYLEAASIQ